MSERLKDHLPTDSDVNSAMLSLVRLQKTYDLPINDLIQGHVAGFQAPPLDQSIAFQLALICLGNGEPDDALKWLTHAYDVTTGKIAGEYEEYDKTPLPAIYQAFGRAYAQVK
jgi:Prolyl 4-Hydroxylase alpha-subunit, N-terminal region